MRSWMSPLFNRTALKVPSAFPEAEKYPILPIRRGKHVPGWLGEHMSEPAFSFSQPGPIAGQDCGLARSCLVAQKRMHASHVTGPHLVFPVHLVGIINDSLSCFLIFCTLHLKKKGHKGPLNRHMCREHAESPAKTIDEILRWMFPVQQQKQEDNICCTGAMERGEILERGVHGEWHA